jgi:hypothetical protein
LQDKAQHLIVVQALEAQAQAMHQAINKDLDRFEDRLEAKLDFDYFTTN